MEKFVTSKVEAIDRVRTAYIMWQDIPIATITEEYSSLSGESDWVISPIWENCEKARARGHVVDIGGIDMDLHKSEYVRRFMPHFVAQRIPTTRREDVREILERHELDGYDAFELLCRSHGVCGDDQYYVSRTPDIVIDVTQQSIPRDIPKFDTSSYGWIGR